MNKRGTILLCALIALAIPSLLPAGQVKTFTSDSYQDFLRGETTNVSIDAEGVLRLSNAVVDAGTMPEALIWCMVTDTAGNLYAGTGFEGRVIKITPDGKSSTFFDSDETHVTALAFDAAGALYAATSPNGKIYRIDAGGKGDVYATTDDKYIWAMVFDTAQNLYAGTGDRGIIRKINKSKEASLFFASGDGNIVSFAFDSSGNLLAGGDTRGALYRITPAGKALAIWSSDLREVRTILPRPDGSILIAATDARREAEPMPPPAMKNQPITTTSASTTGVTPVVTTMVESEAIASVSVTAGQARTIVSEKKARSAVTLLLPDGSTKELWRSLDETVYAVADWTDGKLVVGTGNKGRLYWVDSSGVSGLAAEFDAEQDSVLVRYGKDRVICGTNNKVALYRLSDAPAREGSFLSDVLDAVAPSVWGVARWHARGTGISISTRSGNTAQPDATWSDWSIPLKNTEGDQISSPPARYLQWKAAFTSAAQGEPAEMDTMAISYKQRNSPPIVTSTTLCDPGQVYQKSFSTGEGEYQGGTDFDPNDGSNKDSQQTTQAAIQAGGTPTGRRLFVRGMQTVLWTAEDPNNDDLVYQISFKQIDEKNWRSLKSAYRDTALVIDTTTLPDGTYRIKIDVSDERSNPPKQAMTASRESSVLLIDNTPPRITPLGAGSTSFAISDSLSPIHDIQLSVNGGKWQMLPPKDGLIDGIDETVEVPKQQPGQLVVIKATDERGNFAVYKVQ